jgi:hypothetical protein
MEILEDAGEESKAAGNALVQGNFKNIKRVFGASQERHAVW